MKVGRKRCAECGRIKERLPNGEYAADGICPACGASLDGTALSEFANRLARFGLGATPEPLLNRLPELPDAK
jgi:hypothetical protein